MIPIVAIVLALGALTFTLFVREKDLPEPVPVSPLQHLEDRKQAIYENLRDLQFEYRLGKLSDDDYQQTKQALQRELALVLAEMEETGNRLGLPKARPAVSKPASSVKPVAEASAPVRVSGSVCPHCSARFAQKLKFCGECGKAMA